MQSRLISGGEKTGEEQAAIDDALQSTALTPTRSAVLFLVFNRPDTTRQVFEAIRQAQPRRLYVAADGPRVGRVVEAGLCAEVRNAATRVDWPCEVKTLFRPDNLGCREAVSSAISWFFGQEDEGIVLEDDCLPDPSFFRFCDELLERYRDEPQVMCVSGVTFISKVWEPAESYYFSRYVHIWGWASWRRAWRHYDVQMTRWRTGETPDLLQRVLPRSAQARDHWQQLFDRVSTGHIDTWDFQWVHACWSQGGVSCLPHVNLISNIGFGNEATHTISAEAKMANLPRESMQFPLRHPTQLAPIESADRWTSEHVFDIDESMLSVRRWARPLARRLRRVRSLVGL